MMFAHQLDEAIAKYPKLLKSHAGTTTILKGSIDIVDSNGKHWDSYDIEIHPTADFPSRFPTLFEKGKKIPKNADWHINGDGSCCVAVLPHEIIACTQGISVLRYIEEFVIPFLANQTYRRYQGEFANGEYSHGIKGIVEYYQNLLQIENIQTLISLLDWIIKNPKPSRTNTCFCGSRKKFRYCHRDAYTKIALIGKNSLISDLDSISSMYNIK